MALRKIAQRSARRKSEESDLRLERAATLASHEVLDTKIQIYAPLRINFLQAGWRLDR